MSTIEQNLNDILNARYGKDVRQAIHDGIEACYEDGKAGAVDLIARQRIDEALANKDGIEIIQYKLIDNLSTDMIASGEDAPVTASWQVSSAIAQELQDGNYEYWFLAVSTGWGTIGTNPTWSISGTTVTMKCSVINTSPSEHSILVKMVALLVSKFPGFSDSEAVQSNVNSENTIYFEDSVDAPTLGRAAVLSTEATSVQSIVVFGNGLIETEESDVTFESLLSSVSSDALVYNECADGSLTELPELINTFAQSKWSTVSLSEVKGVVLSCGWYDRDNAETAISALETAIETLLTYLPTIPLFISGPNYMAWKDSYGLLNQNSDSYETYTSKFEEVAKKYRLPYIDNYYELGINSFNRLNYLAVESDRVTLNTAGKEKIARNIVKKLNI